MTYDPQNSGYHNHVRINPNDKPEVDCWARTWEITPEKLRDAIETVGDSTQFLADHFGKKVES